MITILMKSGVNILRVLLLVFIFSVLYIGAFAQPTITLSVSSYQSRIAQLSWTTSDPGLLGYYIVERQTSSSGWIELKLLPSAILAYNDTISYPYCNPVNFSYQIRFISSSGSKSDDTISLPADVNSPLSDQISPANVKNLNVDLDSSNTGFPLISWDKITSDSISRYVIQRYDGFTWQIVANNVPADSGSFYDQTASSVCETSFKYVILTYDRCGNPSAPDYKLFVQTIKLDVAQPGQCDKSAELSWNSYRNIPGSLGRYKIYRSDGSTPVEIDPVNPTDTSFVDNFNFQNGTSYSYTVKAISNNGFYSSSSCPVGWPYNGAVVPDTVYITQVSVENDSYINVGYYFSPAGSVVTMILERSDDGGATFHAVDSLLVSGVAQQNYFSDSTADVKKQSYSYRLVAIDDCGFKTLSMNISRSIWLQCTPSQTQNTLDWNSYQSWLQGVEGYEIYRILDGEPATVKTIGNVDPATVTFPDLLTNYDPTKMPCYWVVANENPGNPYLQNAISRSNECCITKEPILFMPNAFYPDGINKLFRPVPKPAFIDTESFKMTIFSRWGQQLFETTDIVNGWDGTINGKFTPPGQYTYILTYKSLEGKEYTKRGTVFLVR